MKLHKTNQNIKLKEQESKKVINFLSVKRKINSSSFKIWFNKNESTVSAFI